MCFLPSDGGFAEAGERPSSESTQSRHRCQRSAEQRRNTDRFSENLPVQERGVLGKGQLRVDGVNGLAGYDVAPGPPPPAL